VKPKTNQKRKTDQSKYSDFETQYVRSSTEINKKFWYFKW